MKSQFDLSRIRASVIELAAKTKEKKRLRREFLAASRADRSDEAARKSFEEQDAKALHRGQCARYWGLAYAFVRGRLYRTVEQKTRTPLNHLACHVTACLLAVSDLPLEARKHGTPSYYAVSDEVRAWLKTEIHSPGIGDLTEILSPKIEDAIRAFYGESK